MFCEHCQAPLAPPNQKRFCSIRCAAVWRAKQPEYRQKLSDAQKQNFTDPERRRAISERQKARYTDPSNRPWGQTGGEKTSHPDAVRKARSIRIQETKPWQYGGNGNSRSWRQEKLAAALGWESEHVVTTGRNWWPPAYKIDVAEPMLKIAVEVGNVASPLKRQWYELNGWTYLHFSNRMVETWMEGCLTMVMSTISKLQVTTTT